MRILVLLLNKAYPPDERVKQEMDALIAAGHELKMITQRAAGAPKRDEVDGIECIRVKRYNIYLFEMLVTRAARRLYRRWPYDAVHKHDLPMSTRTAGRLQRRLGVKFVADLHENWTGMLEVALAERMSRWKRWVIRGLKRQEKRLLPCSDAVIVVAREHIQRLERLVPGVAEKVVEVPNYAHRAGIDTALSAAERDMDEGKLPQHVEAAFGFLEDHALNIVYFGGLGKHRGIETLIRAVAHLDRPGIGLLIAGGNPSYPYEEGLIALAERRGLTVGAGAGADVAFTGHIAFKYGMALVARADICTVPYETNAHTANTLPHKIFQYMYLKRAVLVSDVPPLKRVVDDAGCGLVFAAGDEERLRTTLDEMVRSDERRAQWGEAGRRAVNARYHWGISADALQRLYRKLRSEGE